MPWSGDLCWESLSNPLLVAVVLKFFRHYNRWSERVNKQAEQKVSEDKVEALGTILHAQVVLIENYTCKWESFVKSLTELGKICALRSRKRLEFLLCFLIKQKPWKVCLLFCCTSFPDTLLPKNCTRCCSSWLSQRGEELEAQELR